MRKIFYLLFFTVLVCGYKISYADQKDVKRFWEYCEHDIDKAEEFLINAGSDFDFNAADSAKRSAILYSIRGSRVDASPRRTEWILFLLNAKRNLRVEKAFGKRPVFKFDPEQKDEDFNTLLLLAAPKLSSDIINFILSSIKNENQRMNYIIRSDVHGDTALHIAVKNGNLSAIHALLLAGADTEVVDFQAETPLQSAIGYDQNPDLNYKIVATLLAGKANPNPENQSDSPLMKAVRLNISYLVQLLLASGADPDQQDERNLDTPLMQSINYLQNISTVRALAARSKKGESLRNFDGKTALQIAEENLSQAKALKWRDEEVNELEEVVAILKESFGDKNAGFK